MWLRRSEETFPGTHFKSLVLVVFGLLLTTGCTDSDDPGKTTGHEGSNPQPTEFTAESYSQALALLNQGVGHLENKEWDEAETALSNLVELLPDSTVAHRNLAISRVFSVVDRNSPYVRSGSADEIARFDEVSKLAESAVTAYRDSAADTYDKALADLLMGKLLIHQDAPDNPTFQDGLTLLKQAADAVPDAADFRLAVAMAMDGHRDYANPNSPNAAELIRQFAQAAELAPENLFAVQKLMQRQALSLNSTDESVAKEAAGVVATLKTATELLKPLNESILKQRRVDLIKTIGDALDSYDGNNAQPLMGPAMVTANLLTPDIATLIDQRRINKNLLEYVQVRFDNEFLAAAREAGAFPKLESTVVKEFVSTTGLPEVTDVNQIEFADMNLDGIDDLIVARSGIVEIYTRSDESSADWHLMTSSPPTEIAITDFHLADLDRDFDRAFPEMRSPALLKDPDGDIKEVKDPSGATRWYDADYDVIAWGKDGVVLLRNTLSDEGKRYLEIIPQQETVSGINDAIAADLEADGDLDLVFATDSGMTLWKNLDGTTFQNADSTAAFPTHDVVSLAQVDWDRNVSLDIVGVSSSGQAGYLENILHGRFRWVEIESPSNTQFAIADPDHDLKWDLVDSDIEGAAPLVHTVRLEDLDNDGFSDLIYADDKQIIWRRGTPTGTFEDPSTELDASVTSSNLTVVDLDDDGDLDLVYVAADDGSLQWLRNEGGNQNRWIDVVARAEPNPEQFPSQRANMHGIGSTIELRAGARYHVQVITQSKTHIGLGKAEQIDTIRVIWTDGVPQNITSTKLLKPRLGVLAPQILIGSCPYIYTWTGEKFEFFSDCLWAAPLGLVQANGELAPTREWENLLIPGEMLVEKDGEYIVQLTEELWETAYFDDVRLTAIDHPEDVQIFTNEKVGPPNLAAHRVHTVRNPRLPVSIVDGTGRDLLPGLTKKDGDYVQAFDHRILQGLTDDWVMEFKLGNLAANTRPKNIRLFLTGWVFPTDTSLNIGIEQNSDLPAPAPPSVEVMTSDGSWKTAIPFIGFPGGKTKAMVVDLSNIFEGDNYRFRIRSSMELYWDQAFFTVDEFDVETVSQDCTLTDADLHFRGYSRRIYGDDSLFRNGLGPEDYDYYSVTTETRWPTICGRFTRYGNVNPLMSEHDDQMVVMGPGDELTLKFAIPDTPVPDGWKRDFVLMNVGYDKDANLNTIYGQSSEPFPFRQMSRYPFGAEDQQPTSVEYQLYLNEWQTRRYSRYPFLRSVRDLQP